MLKCTLAEFFHLYDFSFQIIKISYFKEINFFSTFKTYFAGLVKEPKCNKLVEDLAQEKEIDAFVAFWIHFGCYLNIDWLLFTVRLKDSLIKKILWYQKIPIELKISVYYISPISFRIVKKLAIRYAVVKFKLANYIDNLIDLWVCFDSNLVVFAHHAACYHIFNIWFETIHVFLHIHAS